MQLPIFRDFLDEISILAVTFILLLDSDDISHTILSGVYVIGKNIENIIEISDTKLYTPVIGSFGTILTGDSLKLNAGSSLV